MILNQTDTAAGNILGNDSLGSPPATFTIAGLSPPQTYTPVDSITFQPMGMFTYQPNGTYVFTSNGVTGVAMFVYVLENAGGLDLATVTIEVTGIN